MYEYACATLPMQRVRYSYIYIYICRNTPAQHFQNNVCARHVHGRVHLRSGTANTKLKNEGERNILDGKAMYVCECGARLGERLLVDRVDTIIVCARKANSDGQAWEVSKGIWLAPVRSKPLLRATRACFYITDAPIPTERHTPNGTHAKANCS